MQQYYHTNYEKPTQPTQKGKNSLSLYNIAGMSVSHSFTVGLI